jgi:3-hydroxyisobutyrate dehydrogenase-like beta-hydroxyacid dehydrogenase
MTNITILGTGAMGSRMATKLLEEKHSVTIFNRTKKPALPLIDNGANFATTPLEAVKDADIVISMLTNDEASKSVWLEENYGAIHALKKDSIAIESSTLSTTWIKQLTKEFNQHNIEFLDAPVVGSRPQAEAGGLIFLVGGNETTLNLARPVLTTMASAIHHIGPNGSGTQMKLAVNAFFGVQVSALSEIIGLMEKSGIEKDKTITLFNQLPTTSAALQGIGNLIANNNYNPLFPITLVEKDFRYLLEMARQNNALLPISNTAHMTYKSAIDDNLGEHNIAGVVQLYV